MVIDNLDIERIRTIPLKTNAPLAIDANTKLPASIARKRLKMV